MTGTVEIVMRRIEKSGKITEIVLVSLTNMESSIITHASDVLFFFDLEIYLKEQEVYRSGKLIHLSNQEFLALQFLTEHPGWVCTKEEIYDAVCGEKFIGDVNNTIYCLIRNLRKKLETDPQHPKYIHTIRGIGYKFVGGCRKMDNSENRDR